MLCNKQPKYPVQTAILPSGGSAGRLGLAALGVARLHRSPGMGWVSGHLGGGHWGGLALCLLLGPAVSMAWFSHGNGRGPRDAAGHTGCRLRPGVLSLPSPPLGQRRPCGLRAEAPACAGPRGHETGAREVIAIPPCVGPLNRNYSHSCFSPRKLTSDRASKPVSVEGRIATRLIRLQKWELQPHVLPGEPR